MADLTVQQAGLTVREEDGSGNALTSTLVGSKQSLDVNIAQTVTTSDRSGTGTISALNGTVVATTTGASSVFINVIGTWSATLVFEGQDGNGNWVSILGIVVQNGGVTVGTLTTGSFVFPCGGFNQVRTRAAAYTSGTATVNYNVGSGINAAQVFNTTAASLQTTAHLNDGSGTAITSTTLSGKQRLDVSNPSEGTDGATAPTTSIQIAGKDGNGNLQAVLTDANGAIITSDRLPLSGSSPTAVAVGVTSTTVIVQNASRRGLVITNTSTGIISLNVNSGTALLRSGITLYPGGIWDMDEFTFTTGMITGIASVAASNLAIQEFT